MAELADRPPIGTLLRRWRERRRLSQLALALDAEVSARHLSFVETGRSRPSPEMVLRLAERLEVPLRERNQLLLAAGYAPAYRQRALDEPALASVRDALDRLLRSHEPYPAVVLDHQWEMLAANRGIAVLTAAVDPDLLAPPVNVLRLSLHPRGLAPRIVNLGEWRAHLLERLARQAAVSGDPALAALHQELRGYPAPPWEGETTPGGEIVVPLRLRTDAWGELAFFSTVATFGTAVDVTVAELSVESFFPADAATAAAIARAVPARAPAAGVDPIVARER